jgi:hypothetical protein
MSNDTGEQTPEENLQAHVDAIKLLFDWCGFNFDKPNTVIAMGVKDIIGGKPHSEKAVQAGVLARQKVAERNRKINA